MTAQSQREETPPVRDKSVHLMPTQSHAQQHHIQITGDVFDCRPIVLTQFAHSLKVWGKQSKKRFLIVSEVRHIIAMSKSVFFGFMWETRAHRTCVADSCGKLLKQKNLKNKIKLKGNKL